jgi:hypothetical protein
LSALHNIGISEPLFCKYIQIVLFGIRLGSAELIQNIFLETKDNLVYEPISLDELKRKIDSIFWLAD